MNDQVEIQEEPMPEEEVAGYVEEYEAQFGHQPSAKELEEFLNGGTQLEGGSK